MIIIGEAMHGGEGQSLCKISVVSAQFCCEPKTTLKKMKFISEKSSWLYFWAFLVAQTVKSLPPV